MEPTFPAATIKNTYDLILLDFDGVIVESVEVKSDAFRELFSFKPEFVDEIVRFHRKNGGMSRFEKFRYIYKNILTESLTEQKMGELSERFSHIVMEKVISAPFVTGAEDFLKKYSLKIPLYIISATPQPELDTIIGRKKIASFFKGVYGSPEKKQTHIKNILADTGIQRDSALFIGDSINDWKAANDTQIHFIGRITPATKKDFSGLINMDGVVYNLNELSGLLEE